MCEDHYLPHEFNYIQYEASSGGLSCPESDQRHTYYSDNGTSIPDIRFDGSWYVQVGAPESDANGQFYIQKIDERRTTTSPLAVVVSDFSYQEPGAFAQVKVKLFADIGSPASHYIRVAIVEDDLQYGGSVYQNVLRDMLPNATGTPLTISAAGEEQVVDLDMAVQAGWNTDNLQIIAWVQRDTDKLVLNSGNSFVGEYAASAQVDGPQQVIADGGQVVFDDTNIINVGLNNDTFDVSIDTSSLPDGWDAHLLYDGSEYQQFSVNLDSYAMASFNVVMNTGTVGSGRVVVDIFSQGAGEVIESLDFVALAPGTDFLVVADDGGAGHAYDVYAPALDATGKTYAIWDRGLAAIAGEDLLDYDAVIWETGGNGDVLPAEDRTAIDAYFSAGGNLVLAGEDILESLYNEGGGARLWYQLKLNINYTSAASNNLDIVGVAGDPIGDGVAFTLTGGDPDVPTTMTEDAVVSCEYGDGDAAVTRSTISTYKCVYLPFGLERVPTQTEANDLMYDVLQWLGVLDVTEVDTPAAAVALAQNVPNPFNPRTEIAFTLDRTGPARLEIFNARGQLVRVLADGSLAAGPHEYSWTGETDAGQQAASGTYFYRLTTADETLTRKMMLVK